MGARSMRDDLDPLHPLSPVPSEVLDPRHPLSPALMESLRCSMVASV